MLPDGCTVASREIQRNGIVDNFDYNAEAAITEFKWSPDYDNIMETGKLVCWSPDHFSPGNSILTVVGIKSGKEKEFIIHMDYEGDKNNTGKKKYIISPVNCKIKQDSIAAFLLEEK